MQVIPARSPDLNPIKNLFNIVRKCIEAEILEQNIYINHGMNLLKE